ncbi:MAG TPA: SURF1 family protein [Polymorphobacter sp.]|jgi:surfeit locus 1 family protein|nr:SURF1 family protein [Polymorphobacter sp.]
MARIEPQPSGPRRRRGLPLGATLMTLLMVPVLIGMGLWQLQRREWKAHLNAELAAAPSMPVLDAAGLTAAPGREKSLLYRRASVHCAPGSVAPYDIKGGDSADGQSGYLLLVNCTPADPKPAFIVVAGWSQRPDTLTKLTVDTTFDGLIIERPYGNDATRPRFMLIPRQSVPPLAPSRVPTPGDLPDNHLSYALQWFGFALVLLTIFGIYVRRWRRGE